MTSGTSNRRLLWSAAIGLWLIGCLVIALGAGIWWGRRLPTESAATAASPVAAVTSLPTESPPTTAPSPEPATATPTAAKENDDNGQSAAGDSLNASTEEKSETKGDTLAIPTPTVTPAPEGVILFLSSRDHEPQSEARTQHRDVELYAMRPNGSDQTRLSDGTQPWGSETAVLTGYSVPHQVVISGRYVFDLKTREVVDELTSAQTIDGQRIEFGRSSSSDSFLAVDPVWSSTGAIVFFNKGIYVLDSINSQAEQLTVPPDDTWGDGFPAWSPDGKWIVFSRDWEGQTQDGLWVVKADGSEIRRVFQKDTGQFSARRVFWSPDGSTLAFEGPKQNPENFSFELWTTDLNSDISTQLTTLPDRVGVWKPVWNPNGQHIAFVRKDATALDSDIFVINANGGEPKQMTNTGFYNMEPLWLPLDADEILAGGDTPLLPTPTPKPRPKPTPIKGTTCPAPGAQISSPAPGTRFTQRNNFIIGTANIPRFHHWRIEYSTDPNGGWNYLLERDYPVDNDKLVMIDASTVPNGPYGLRLTVVDETGNYPEPCEVWFVNGY